MAEVITDNVAIAVSAASTTFSAPGTVIGEVTAITLPSYSGDAVDVTSMDSTDGVREFIKGLTDPGEITIDINYNPNDATDILLTTMAKESGWREINIAFTLADASTEDLTVKGFVTSYAATGTLGEQMTASITVKVTGAPVWGS